MSINNYLHTHIPVPVALPAHLLLNSSISPLATCIPGSKVPLAIYAKDVLQINSHACAPSSDLEDNLLQSRISVGLDQVHMTGDAGIYERC